MDWSEIYKLAAVAGASWSAAWFMVNKQNLIYKRLDQLRDIILSKLEYHERHDDERFEAVRKDLWQIRIANAALTGKANGNGVH